MKIIASDFDNTIYFMKDDEKNQKNIWKNALGALHAKTGGIVCPYELTISAIEHYCSLQHIYSATKDNFERTGLWLSKR